VREQRIGVVGDYDKLHIVQRAHADELSVTRETLDAAAGLQPGYGGKILAPKPVAGLAPP